MFRVDTARGDLVLSLFVIPDRGILDNSYRFWILAAGCMSSG